MTRTLDTDYLIVGTGAVGMAFADTLLSETDADMVLVDRFAKPGGHWNDAYPFVTLHQPSAFYGVPSRELSRGTRDEVGLNRGLADLATGQEVLGYFDAVMRERFLPSGRVRYFPMHDYLGDRTFVSKLSGETYRVEADKVVDCTILKTSIPKTHRPNFEVEGGVRFIPPNDLPDIADAPDGFVVVGGGKTGIDTVLWLLEQGVEPKSVRWVMSRDAWWLDRANTQTHPDFFAQTIGAQVAQYEALAGAESAEDAFLRMEAGGYFHRLDPDVMPTMFHGATVSRAEAEALRTVEVVRMGRVAKITPKEISLRDGTIPTTPETVHVDCSATAIKNYTPVPVFDGDRITPQTVRPYQPVFSASLIAHIEANHDDEATKNELAEVVRLPDTLADYFHFTRGAMMNQFRWSQDKALREWIAANRLDGFSNMIAGATAPEDKALLKRLRAAMPMAAMKLNHFIEETADA